MRICRWSEVFWKNALSSVGDISIQFTGASNTDTPVDNATAFATPDAVGTVAGAGAGVGIGVAVSGRAAKEECRVCALLIVRLREARFFRTDAERLPVTSLLLNALVVAPGDE